MCVYVCVRVCVCQCARVSVCLCVCLYVCTCMCACVRACLRACIRVCVCGWVGGWVGETVCVCVYVHVCMCVCGIFASICACTYVCMYVCVCVQADRPYNRVRPSPQRQQDSCITRVCLLVSADYSRAQLIIRQQQQNEPESAWMAEIMTTECIAVSQASEARLSFTSAMLYSGDVLWHCVLVRL